MSWREGVWLETSGGQESGQVRKVQTGCGEVRSGLARHGGEVGLGHLEGAEEEAGAFGIEGGVGEAADDLRKGDLEGFGIGDGRYVEGCGFGHDAAGRAAGGGGVEAELLAAEGGRAAALAGGAEVVAGWTGCGHDGLLGTSCGSRRGTSCGSRRTARERQEGCRSGTCRFKCERPSADAGPFFVHCFNCNESSETQLYFCGIFDLVCFVGCGRVLHRGGGLTRFSRFKVRGSRWWVSGAGA